MTTQTDQIGAGQIEAAPMTQTQQMDGLPFFFRQVLKIASHIQYGTLVFELPDGRTPLI